MIRAAIVVPIALCAVPAHARFAPPLGVPLKLTIIQSRDASTGRHRFVAERTIVFQGVTGGFTADVTLDAVRTEGDAAARRMFEAGLAGLLRRTIRFRLDQAGAPTGIDDFDAVWAAWTAGIATMAPARSDAATAAAGQADRYTALPLARRQAMLGSILTSLIAPELALGERPIQVRTQAASGSGAPLAGREKVERRPGGLIRASSKASGTILANTATATVSVETVRSYDLATGLIRESSETNIIAMGAKRSTTNTTVTLTVR